MLALMLDFPLSKDPFWMLIWNESHWKQPSCDQPLRSPQQGKMRELHGDRLAMHAVDYQMTPEWPCVCHPNLWTRWLTLQHSLKVNLHNVLCPVGALWYYLKRMDQSSVTVCRGAPGANLSKQRCTFSRFHKINIAVPNWSVVIISEHFPRWS